MPLGLWRERNWEAANLQLCLALTSQWRWYGQTHHLGVPCMLVTCWSVSFPSGLCTWFSFPWQPGHTGVGRAGFVLVCSQVYLDCSQAKVHKPGWPQGILLPSSTDCPSDSVPVKSWGSSTEPGFLHTTSTSGGSRCACASGNSFTREILQTSMSFVVR